MKNFRVTRVSLNFFQSIYIPLLGHYLSTWKLMSLMTFLWQRVKTSIRVQPNCTSTSIRGGYLGWSRLNWLKARDLFSKSESQTARVYRCSCRAKPAWNCRLYTFNSVLLKFIIEKLQKLCSQQIYGDGNAQARQAGDKNLLFSELWLEKDTFRTTLGTWL